MTSCTQLSDRMPDVAHGASRWTETEERHLAACADCRAEWELVTAACRLGAPFRPPADPALMASLVLERLAHERRRARFRVRLWPAAGLAAAAAVILAVWTGVGVRPGGDGARGTAPRVATAPPDAPRAELPLPELDDLPAEALDSILQALDSPGARADTYELPGLGDPGDRELERALTGLEG